MFTLSGLILETRQNLFRDFWSPFSISFYFSSERIYKKTEIDYGPYPARKPPARPLYSARPGARERASPALRNPSRRRPRSVRRQPPPPRESVVAAASPPAATRRPAPPHRSRAAAASPSAAGDSRHLRFSRENRSVFRRFFVRFF